MNKLGSQDYLPPKLYGRSAEQARLHDQFNLIKHGPRAVFVTGTSGSGKTVLVNKTLQKRGTLFLSGKFDRFQSRDAYDVLIDAFSGLSEMSYSEQLMEGLLPLVQEYSAALMQIIPSLQAPFRHLLSKSIVQEESLKTGWSFQLLKVILRAFLKEVCRFNKVCLFLDDLQWADSSYLNLITGFLNDPEMINFFFVGSYRSDELTADHHLYDQIQLLANLDCSSTIHVSDLSQSACNTMVSEILHLEPERTLELVSVVHKNTAGNAFFVLQYMQMLERSGLLRFSETNFKWEFNIAQIKEEASLADNIVDAIVSKIRQLPPKAQCALKIAASLGSRFDPEMIGYLLDKIDDVSNTDSGDEDISTIFAQCSQQDLIVSVEMQLPDFGSKTFFRFTHDKIQLGSYSLIPMGEHALFHLNLGRILRDNLMNTNGDLILFVTTGQLNRGISLLQDQAEILDLATLNLKSAKALRNKSAFIPSSEFVDRTLELLGDSKWSMHYDLCIESLVLGAELDYCRGKGERCRLRVNEILENAKLVKEKIPSCFIRIELETINSNYSEALSTGYNVMRLLGMKIPKRVGVANVAQELFLIFRSVGKYTDSDLLSLAWTSDDGTIQKIKGLQSILSSAFMLNRTIEYAYFAILSMKLTIKHGLTEMAGAVFATFGSLCMGLRKFDQGQRFGHLGLKLDAMNTSRSYRCKTMLHYYGAIYPVSKSVYLSVDPLLEAYRIGMEVGDLDHAYFAICSYVSSYFFAGLSLKSLVSDMKMFISRLMDYGQPVDWMKIFQYYFQALAGDQKEVDELLIVEETVKRITAQRTTSHNLIRVKTASSGICMQLGFNFRDQQVAVKAARENELFKDLGFPGVQSYQWPFFRALIWIEAARSQSRRCHHLRKARVEIQKMKKWMAIGAVNMHHLLYIVKAEYMTMVKLDSNRIQAVKGSFDDAIRVCSRLGFSQHAALANELCGRFMIRENDADWASFYVQRSITLYQEWGAQAKVRQLCHELDLVPPAETCRNKRNGALKGRQRYEETDQSNVHEGKSSGCLWSLTSTIDFMSIHSSSSNGREK